jgi:hypothetical protein
MVTYGKTSKDKESTDPYDWVYEQDKNYPSSLEHGLPLTIAHYGEDVKERSRIDQED